MYCSIFNRFFDIFNTSEGKVQNYTQKELQNDDKLPYGAKLISQEQTLKEIADVTSKMRKSSTPKSSKLVFFQKGILLNCAALSTLHSYLTEIFPTEKIEICTYNINQDIVESFFSVLRSMGGTNTTPNPLEVKYRIRRYLVMKDPEAVILMSSTNVIVEKGVPTLTGEVTKKICKYSLRLSNNPVITGIG